MTHGIVYRSIFVPVSYIFYLCVSIKYCIYHINYKMKHKRIVSKYKKQYKVSNQLTSSKHTFAIIIIRPRSTSPTGAFKPSE